MRFDYDLITLGAGSGGVAGSRRAASYGARVAIVESTRVGGTCVLRGCVPKKLLWYGVQFGDAVEDAAGYGWEVAPPTHDWAALVAAKDRELDRLNGIYLAMLERAGVAVIDGRGTLVDRHTVAVGDRRLTAERILIATGGTPIMPEIPGAELAINSDAALDLKTRPERVLIVGGGYIAVEFAGIFRSAGAAVTMAIRGDRVLRGFDGDLRDHLTAAMTARGIAISATTTVRSLARTSGGIRAELSNGAALDIDVVLAATGRRPNTAGIGLEAAGVDLNRDGAIIVDQWSRSSVPNIFAVGDVTDRLNLTPVAIAEARGFAETTYNDNPMPIDHADVPTAVFSHPECGTVGMTEEHARTVLGAVDVYLARFTPMKNILAGRAEKTLMKLVVDPASDRVLGVHMVGPDAPEIIQGMAIAVKCGATKTQFDRTVGIHPSAAEEFVTMREKRADPVPRPVRAAE